MPSAELLGDVASSATPFYGRTELLPLVVLLSILGKANASSVPEALWCKSDASGLWGRCP